MASQAVERLIMLTMLRFMRMSTEMITTAKTIATMILKGTALGPKSTTTSIRTMITIVGMMGGMTCGESPDSHGKVLCRVDLYIC